MKKFFNEFKEFAMRGNVLDMAIGVILATAFGQITSTLINNVLMPLIGWAFGGIDLSKLDIVLREAVMDGEALSDSRLETCLPCQTFASPTILLP